MQKGFTAQLRALGRGEMIQVTDVQRANIYLVARRIGISVKVEKTSEGFDVTRTDGKAETMISYDPVRANDVDDFDTDFDFGA